jgi:dTDP-4-dehydrorhamnose 3,5-epimerase
MIGVEIVPLFSSQDERGYFKKMYSSSNHQHETRFNFQEIFYSKTIKHGIRGFHLQNGIASNYRVISVVVGSVRDYLLDLRTTSKTYGEVLEYDLDENSHSLLVPPGVAHALYALETSIVLYATTSVYNPEFDTGVRFDSVIDTTHLPISVVSIRDQHLPTLQEYKDLYND